MVSGAHGHIPTVCEKKVLVKDCYDSSRQAIKRDFVDLLKLCA